MDKNHKIACFVSLGSFIFSIVFIIASFSSDYWVRSEIIDSRKFRPAGFVHTGIFRGDRQIDYGDGLYSYRFSIFAELQEGHSFFTRAVWIFVLFFEAMSLIWSLMGVITCIFSITSLKLDVSVAGPNGIYLWSLLSSISHGGALALFYSQFQSSLRTSMLLAEHLDLGYTTFNQATLSYAFYMSLCALFSLYIPPLTLVLFTERIVTIGRKSTSSFDPTLMLY